MTLAIYTTEHERTAAVTALKGDWAAVCRCVTSHTMLQDQQCNAGNDSQGPECVAGQPHLPGRAQHPEEADCQRGA